MSIVLGDVLACHCTREQYATMRFDRFVMHLADGQRSFLLRCPAPRPKEGTFSWRVPPTFPNFSSAKVEVAVPPNVKPGDSFAFQAPDTRVYKLRYEPALHRRARRDHPAATSRRRPHHSTRIAQVPQPDSEGPQVPVQASPPSTRPATASASTAVALPQASAQSDHRQIRRRRGDRESSSGAHGGAS